MIKKKKNTSSSLLSFATCKTFFLSLLGEPLDVILAHFGHSKSGWTIILPFPFSSVSFFIPENSGC